MQNRTVALLVIAACNFFYMMRMVAETGMTGWLWWGGNAIFLALLVVAALARDKRIIATSLAFLVGSHAVLLFSDKFLQMS
jgi:hypothetical protein